MSRRARALAIALVVGWAGSACGSSTPMDSSSAASTSPPRELALVALGDSVPRGTNCDCRPYPSLSADRLAAATGTPAAAFNDSVAGYRTSDVLRQLGSDQAVMTHVEGADVVEIEVGANDVAFTSSCGTSVTCYTARVPDIEKNLAEIVARAQALRGDHKTLIVLLDYWSVWLGGQYAAAQGEAYVAAAESMTAAVNAVIKSTSVATHSAYVDLRAAFKGPDYAYDETHYLSNDGDHPNAAGHQQIASAVAAVVAATIHP